jgi:UDPglucose 6-dehydrogenase/GDP-mannose 6-dehydrogenase
MATLISYSNEIADFCEATDDVDVADVMRGLHEMKHLNFVGLDGARRQASVTAFLWPGCGFGGSCFPKDVKALVSQNLTKQVPTDLLTSVLKINQRRPDRMVGMLQQRFPDLRDVAVTVLGLAFKPGTDDVRESPALPIVAQLLRLGARVTCHDPVATGSARTALASLGLDVAGIRFVSDIEAAVDEASAVLLVTSWPMYRDIPRLLEARSAQPLLSMVEGSMMPGTCATTPASADRPGWPEDRSQRTVAGVSDLDSRRR